MSYRLWIYWIFIASPIFYSILKIIGHFFLVHFRYMKVCVVLQIDSDKTIMVTFKHDDKLQEGFECAFQVLSKTDWHFFFSKDNMYIFFFLKVKIYPYYHIICFTFMCPFFCSFWSLTVTLFFHFCSVPFSTQQCMVREEFVFIRYPFHAHLC